MHGIWEGCHALRLDAIGVSLSCHGIVEGSNSIQLELVPLAVCLGVVDISCSRFTGSLHHLTKLT